MPNYCENYLSIEGNTDTLKEIMNSVKSDESVFDFEKIVPMPDYIYRGVIGAKESELYGENNWYDWSNKNWGTKWNSVDAESWNDGIQFLTAWSPCTPVIAALAEKYPTMRFTYTFYETGMCFCGKRIYENGEIIFNYDGDYAENPMWEYDDEEADGYLLEDSLFPIKENGFNELVVRTKKQGSYVGGKLFYREYEKDKIFRMTEGFFVADENFVFECERRQGNEVLEAA